MTKIYRGHPLIIHDAHTHIYPAKIAEKASASVGSFYGIPVQQAGFPHALVESGDKIGVSRYLVCSVATKPEQVASINHFIHEQCLEYPQFIGFAALHPQQTDWEAEVERILELGLCGVKLHPDFQAFNIDDEHMLPVYRKLAACGLPVLFHMGDDRYDFSSPERLWRVMQAVPDLLCLAAHFGGYQRWSEAARYLLDGNVFFDTSSSLWRLSGDEAVGLIHHFGADRLMFGTDFPMWNHEDELERFLALGLTDEENDLILHQNFERIILSHTHP